MRCASLLVALALVMACASAHRAPSHEESPPEVPLPTPTDESLGCAGSPAETVCFAHGLGSLGRDAPEDHFDERPPRATRLRAFAMDRDEVSVEAWQTCVSAGRCTAPACPLDATARAVRCVAWDDAVAYCAFRHGRLPTEAEWERVAGGVLPGHRAYPWGDAHDGAEALADVTPEGVHAMGGGVAEWVMDPGGFYPVVPGGRQMDAGAMAEVPEDEGDGGGTDAAVLVTTVPTVERTAGGMVVVDNPHGPTNSPWRVVRGGDEGIPVARRTTTLRRFRQRTDRLPWVGLRCVYGG